MIEMRSILLSTTSNVCTQKVNTVIHGDCIEVLKTFPKNSFDLILQYGRKKDVYKITVTDNAYRYTPAKGSFSKINDGNDDGIAEIRVF